ncbi:MAG: dienelactone hydrolase family protein [Chloroherpetonaceae bacterium]|nr:dienelactone hydrolase family protein [Chloroherpetonaceae bacterium]
MKLIVIKLRVLIFLYCIQFLNPLPAQSQTQVRWIKLNQTHRAAIIDPLHNEIQTKRKQVGAVIYLHDEWGLDSLALLWCKEIANAGFTVIAPDLLGRVPEDAMEAHEIERAQPEGAFISLLNIARDTLLAQAEGKPIKIGVYGIGMGATAAVEALLADTILPTKFTAAAITIAALPFTPTSDLFQKILPPYLLPLIGNFGEKDLGTPPDAVKNFKQRLIACGRGKFLDFDFRIHAGARRGFMRPKNGIEAKAAISSRSRVIKFLKKELK